MMIELPVLDTGNRAVRQVAVPEEVFGLEVRGDLLARAVNYQLTRRRGGNASTKGRSDVAGGGKKPFRQKGTGNARQGTVSAPHYRSGGVVFGPLPKSYATKLPKKVRLLALKSALSAKLGAGELIIVDQLNLAEVKTKAMRTILETLGIGRSALVVLSEENSNVALSIRNLPGMDVMRVEGVNVYDLLAHEKVVMTEDALGRLQERLV